MRRLARLGARHAGAAITILVMLGWLVWLRPATLGGGASYILLRGDSMEPTYYNGALIFLDRAAEYGVGDIVAYRVPNGSIGAGHVVIHRIVGIASDGALILQGDNNPSIDPWGPRTTDVVGVARASVPAVGTVLAMLTRPAVAGALALAMFVAWAIGSGGPGSRRRSGAQGGHRPRYSDAAGPSIPPGHDRGGRLRRPARVPEARA